MAAFELAMEEGADGIELDVRLDRDGDVIVAHDRDLARVTAGRDVRRFEDVGRAELSSVDLGGGERIPRLEDVLRWARKRRARVNVELKRDVSRPALLAWKVVRLVALQHAAPKWLILSSFDPKLVAGVAHLLPWVPVGRLVESPGPVPARTLAERMLGASALHPQASLATPEAIGPWRRAGLPVNVWTVNEPDEARRLARIGVDALISDEPGNVLRALRER
jgi:glycerophosphoryl diester phosphodiesterase